MRPEARGLGLTRAYLLRMLAVGTVLLAAGCERPSDPTRSTISREQFIEVYVALRQVDETSPSAAEQRGAVLRGYGVTEDEMRAFVAARTQRPQELAEIWEEIQRRLERRLEEQEAEEAEPPASPPPV